jgi:hypothetical protein
MLQFNRKQQEVNAKLPIVDCLTLWLDIGLTPTQEFKKKCLFRTTILRRMLCFQELSGRLAAPSSWSATRSVWAKFQWTAKRGRLSLRPDC